MRETFSGAGSLPLSDNTILDVLFLVFWALLLIVTLKYIMIVMRADN